MAAFTPKFDGYRKGSFRPSTLGSTRSSAPVAAVEVPTEEPTRAAPAPTPAHIEELLETAKKAGHAEATAELLPEIEILEQTIAALGPALDEIAHTRRKVLELAANDVGEIVLAICGRVLDEAFNTRPEAIARVVKDAVSQMPEAEDVRIAVPPGMLEHVTRNVDPRFRSAIVPDGSIGNGCVIRTRYVTLDATLDSALAGVEAAVKEWVGLQPWTGESSR